MATAAISLADGGGSTSWGWVLGLLRARELASVGECVSSSESAWSVYLSVSVSVGSVHCRSPNYFSLHTTFMITRAFILLQTYVKVANVSDSLTVTPNVWQSVMGMQWNVMLYQSHLYITKLVTESTGLSYLQAAVQYWDMEPVPLYLELRKSSPTSRSR